MRFALSMILLFVGYCWYANFRSSLLEGSEWSSASDDEAEDMTGLAEMLDESLKTKTEDYQAWHNMGFMTPDHVLPTTSQDWEGTP